MSGGVFECPVPVRWSDQDANGHVNNARVVTLLEEIRIAAYLAWLDSTPDSGLPRVVRTLTVDFRRAVHRPGVTAADEATAAARQTTSPPTDHGAPPPPADRRS
ncbi:acyl-CoA thioesterase [Micrococcus lacusdianchii]|uniref:acyl-CoA thioesterase n=1 Tax=Micrococcus lacusdianchii TaxID=2915940 RepID=UPI0020038653